MSDALATITDSVLKHWNGKHHTALGRFGDSLKTRYCDPDGYINFRRHGAKEATRKALAALVDWQVTNG